MTERQFNHIEKKIKEAATNIQPVYYSQAWDRMEKLLDKQKRKNRPVFWWWVTPVVVSIVAIILYLAIPTPVNKESAKRNTGRNSVQKIMKDTNDSNIQKSNNGLPAPKTKILEKKNANKLHSALNIVEMKSTTIRFDKMDSTVIALEKKKSPAREANFIGNDPTLPGVNSKHKVEKKKSPLTETNALAKENKKHDSIPESDPVALQKLARTESKNSFHSRLYLTSTGGVDAPGLKVFSNSGSQISVKAGIGLGYQINKKFSLETGFFLGSKKYIAGPENYKYPDDSYWNTVELIQVDADCFIYEIPLLLKYNFFQKKSLILNVGAGLESFIMKKENYIYDYLKNGTRYTSSRSYSGNNHFLSSVQFSIGLEKKLNQKISLLVTPSVSIPISGVGNGKVKLHYTSFQAGIKYFPFQKK